MNTKTWYACLFVAGLVDVSILVLLILLLLK